MRLWSAGSNIINSIVNNRDIITIVDPQGVSPETDVTIQCHHESELSWWRGVFILRPSTRGLQPEPPPERGKPRAHNNHWWHDDNYCREDGYSNREAVSYRVAQALNRDSSVNTAHRSTDNTSNCRCRRHSHAARKHTTRRDFGMRQERIDRKVGARVKWVLELSGDAFGCANG